MRSRSSRPCRAAAALNSYRWGCRVMLALQVMVVTLRRNKGLLDNWPPIASIIFFGTPSIICGFFGEGGCLAVPTEIVLNEVFHFVNFGVLVPLYLAFYDPISTVVLTRYVLIMLALATTVRAYLCHMKVLNELSTTSMLPHIITLLPLYCATVYRLAWDEGIPEENSITLVVCLVINGFNVLLHHHKVVGMEELVVDLLATLADRAVLLRSAFDATCDVRVLPRGPGEAEAKGLAGTLQVLRSSKEMDKLCCCSMGAEILNFQRVTSGLPNLTEIVMRALDPTNDPVQNRTMVTLQDYSGFELDCEVRAVASGQSSDRAVLCGLRQIGEKRKVLREEEAELMASAEAQGTGESPKKVGETSGAGGSQESLGEWVMKSMVKFWAFLRADPEPERLPSTQAVFRALRSVSRLLWVECDVNSLEIVRASPAAMEEFPAPVLGRTIPTLLVSGSCAQKLRKALFACSDLPWADLVASGCHSQRFGDVALRLSGGPSVPVVVHLILMPSATATQPPVLVLIFDKLPISSLRSVTAMSVRSSDADSVSQAGPVRRTRGGRTLSWAGDRSNV